MADAIDIVVDDEGPLGGLTDEEISTLSEDELERRIAEYEAAQEGEPSDAKASEPDSDLDEDQAGTVAEEEDTGIVEAGGAADSYQSLEPDAGVPDNTSAEQSETDSDGEEADDESEQSTEDGQSSEAAESSEDESEPTEQTDWKAKYEELLAPFKASKRVVKVESPEDARRLMQMGYDYTQKMRQMKPHQKVLKALEANDLLEPEKINFAIDLLNGNKEAVAKFLKDKSIDPIDVDLEDSTDYTATDHTPGDAQLALDEVLDSIRDTEQFPRTAQVITKEWDKASQEVLMGDPSIIAILNEHMGLGYYDQIATKVQYERSLGRLRGLSDLNAYKTVGDAMQARGEFKPRDEIRNTPSGPVPPQGQEQDPKGSKGRKARKRAASPPKGKASAGNAQPKSYLSDFTDEEIANMS
jgi:hypothetical protein